MDWIVITVLALLTGFACGSVLALSKDLRLTQESVLRFGKIVDRLVAERNKERGE